MKLKKTIFILMVNITYYLLPVVSFAQDSHLSHYDAAPHYFNPALTGMYFNNDAGFRVYSDYRSQWGALKSFSTYYLAYDMPFNKQYGIGGYLIHKRNGAGGMNTINFMPSAAYKITGGKNSPHLSVGFQIGILYKRLDPNHFNYEAQFSPSFSTGFDSKLPSNETFDTDKNSVLRLDASMGAFYRQKESNSSMTPWAGLAIYHVTMPSQPMMGIIKDSITGKKIDRLGMRIVLQAGAEMEVNRELKLKPMILYMSQRKGHELNIGSLGFYELSGTDYEVVGGLHYRWKDALILQAGIRYEGHVFRFGYDIGTSYLSKGSFEVSFLFSGL